MSVATATAASPLSSRYPTQLAESWLVAKGVTHTFPISRVSPVTGTCRWEGAIIPLDSRWSLVREVQYRGVPYFRRKTSHPPT